jgi:integrase-like protein
VYELPEQPIEQEPAADSFVFLCGKHRPWNRTALGTKFKRLRKKLGLPASCKLYGIRHFHITDAVRKGVNLKAVATLAGHVDTRMIERVYCHVDGDLDFLHQAAQLAVSPPAPNGAPAQKETGGTNLVPPVYQPPVIAAPAMPLPDLAQQLTGLVEKLTRRLAGLDQARPAPVETPPPPPAPPRLTASHQIAYRAAKWALEQQPGLKTDGQIYEWLRGRPEYAGQLPPTLVTFRRYLTQARRVIDGAGKREQRRRTLTTKPTEAAHG